MSQMTLTFGRPSIVAAANNSAAFEPHHDGETPMTKAEQAAFLAALAGAPEPEPEPAPSFETIEVGTTFEGEGFRVHRYRDSLVLTDLADAGKRGARCHEVGADYYGQDHGAASTMCVALRAATDYEGAALVLAQWAAHREDFSMSLHARELRALDVAPAGFEIFRLSTDKLGVRLEWDSFCLADPTDRNNEPRTIPGRGSKVAAAAKARKLVAKLGDAWPP